MTTPATASTVVPSRRKLQLFRPWPKISPPPGGGRDIALDVVRSWALIVVVFGHFFMNILFWPAGAAPTSSNTLSSGDPWPYATWLLQVMPLFFVAGAAVNAGSWERFNGTWSAWVWQRVSRLMRPTMIFLLTIAVIFSVVSLVADRSATDVLLTGVTGPLWFLAVYIPVTAMTPALLRAHERAPVVTAVALLCGVLAGDALRFGVMEPLGAVNLLVAWLFVYQLGFWYRRGVSRAAAVWLIAAGLAGNVALTSVFGAYPKSLVGLPTEEFSNMAPPTVVLVFHSLVLFGLFVLLAPAVRSLFSRPAWFAATARAGMIAMTLYLWHMLVLVGLLSVLHFLGLDLPTKLEGGLPVPDGLAYWVALIPVSVLYGAALWVVVRLLWPFEYARLPLFDVHGKARERSRFTATLGLALISLGLLAISGAGMSGFPMAVHVAMGVPVNSAAALVCVVAGVTLVRPR